MKCLLDIILIFHSLANTLQSVINKVNKINGKENYQITHEKKQAIRLISRPNRLLHGIFKDSNGFNLCYTAIPASYPVRTAWSILLAFRQSPMAMNSGAAPRRASTVMVRGFMPTAVMMVSAS